MVLIQHIHHPLESDRLVSLEHGQPCVGQHFVTQHFDKQLQRNIHVVVPGGLDILLVVVAGHKVLHLAAHNSAGAVVDAAVTGSYHILPVLVGVLQHWRLGIHFLGLLGLVEVVLTVHSTPFHVGS